ncbi:hypothetical protein [Actinoalloteichus hymeniacidonis]|uniref:Uncharacterized protein n=1 Tax=Actinoalloteichus hymeniacidonis TaxID=340345 RepID=A0AAC9HU26_9PSEU|nr:hypothetical protein [Actinoalloteichus hymeniacidonis]AOS65617.1 hypothetical protein TL08_24195 [Actinoalloteichus hymeniacidonis]MBB5906292.1 hypothetical protein [Actinoalloteichus hymeniacidonis]
MIGPWFVRSVDDGDTHRAHSEYWTPDGRAHIRPLCAPAVLFTALNRQPVAVPYYDEHRCPTCLTARRASGRPSHLAVVR